MKYLREVMGSLGENGRTIVVVVVILSLLVLAGLLVWRGENLDPFWGFLGS